MRNIQRTVWPLLLAVIILTPAPAAAYAPPPHSVLYRMATALHRGKAAEIQVTLADGTGEILEDGLVTIPLAEPIHHGERRGGIPFTAPFYLFTLPLESYPAFTSYLLGEEAVTAYTRIDRQVCYLLSGGPVRLWVRKADLVPLRLELAETDGTVTRYEYVDPSPAGGKHLYPVQTVVTNSGRTLYTETLTLPGGGIGP